MVSILHVDPNTGPAPASIRYHHRFQGTSDHLEDHTGLSIHAPNLLRPTPIEPFFSLSFFFFPNQHLDIDNTEFLQSGSTATRTAPALALLPSRAGTIGPYYRAKAGCRTYIHTAGDGCLRMSRHKYMQPATIIILYLCLEEGGVFFLSCFSLFFLKELIGGGGVEGIGVVINY